MVGICPPALYATIFFSSLGAVPAHRDPCCIVKSEVCVKSTCEQITSAVKLAVGHETSDHTMKEGKKWPKLQNGALAEV